MRDTLTPLLSDPAGPARGRRLRLLFGAVLAVLATVAFLVPPAAVGSSDAADEWPWDVEPGEDSDLFPLVAEIDFRGSDGELLTSPPAGVGVDPELGVAVFVGGREIFLVDTRTFEQTVIPDPGGDHVINDEQVVLDADNHRLIFVGSSLAELPGEDTHGCGGLLDQVCPVVAAKTFAVTVVALDGDQQPVTRTLELPHFDEQADSALNVSLAEPMDYHAATDNLYFGTERGEVSLEPDDIGNTRPILHEVSMEELLARGPEDEAVASTWSYQLETCSKISDKGSGALARGRQGDFVYVACEGGAGAPHGVMRVDLVGGQDASDTSNFRSTFDPLVGDMSDGVVGTHRARDLVFVQLTLSSSRLFVYDAYRRAWTGGLELPGKNQRSPAAHPTSGRLYAIDASNSTLRVTEAAWPAVPNSSGRRADHDAGGVTGGHKYRDAPVVDPVNDQLFVKSFRMCLEEAEDGFCARPEDLDNNRAPHFRVFEDRLPHRPARDLHPDYDARTADLPEEPGVATSTATGNAKAFGARHLFVGGTANAAYTSEDKGGNHSDGVVRSAPLGPGTRDTIRGQVIGTNLSRISTPTVGALATGLRIADEQTKNDLQKNTNVRCAPSRTASRLGGEADCLSDEWQSDEPGEQERELHRRWDGSSWPDEYPEEMRGRSAYCDDFGGDPSDDVKLGSAVACDSGVPQVSAGALFSPTEENASTDGETSGMHVGYAESSTDIREDESLGMVATASAVARDVDLFGQVSIGEVRTEATVVAHGRPGTASTELVREYRQVRIGDFACGWQDSNPCDLYEVARQINAQLGPKVAARVPAQDTFLNPEAGDEPDAQTGAARVSNGTPGGAKALVTLDPYQFQSGKAIANDTRSELPGLQITVYHDGDRTSRQILQLAAVELDATYLISPAATWDPPDWGSGDGTGGDDGLDLDGGLPDPTGVGGAATRSIVPPPPFAHLSQDPPSTTSDDGPPTTGDSGQGAGDVAGFDGDDGTVSQGQAPSLGTADAPAVSTGDGVPAPEVASDSSGEQPVAVQDTQGGSSGPGGLMLTRQRMGQTVPLAVLWVLAALPFYLAVRRRRLTASAPRT